MEAIINIPLVDVLSKMLEKRVVMSGDKYVEFDGVKEIPQATVELALIEKVKLEKKMSVPSSITMRQTKLHLLDLELLDQVEAIISQNRKWQIEWSGSVVERNSPLIDIFKTSLALTDEQVDDMFITASKLCIVY
jgi:hypothetical protein